MWDVLGGAQHEWGRILPRDMDIGPRGGVLEGEGDTGARHCTQKQRRSPPGCGDPAAPRERLRVGETEAQSAVLRAARAARGIPSALTFSLGWSTATS